MVCEMLVLDQTGDTKIIWDSENRDEVDNARRTFEDLTKKGYLAFKVKGEKGEKGEQVRTFEAGLERLILVPPMVGG